MLRFGTKVAGVRCLDRASREAEAVCYSVSSPVVSAVICGGENIERSSSVT